MNPDTESIAESGGFAFKLDFSAPYLAVAIHAGHRVRGELLSRMRISEKERTYEEDVATDRMIQDLSSTIRGIDSRTEYDLNRPPESAIPLTPGMFWGVTVFHYPPPPEMNRTSMIKYHAFYSFVQSCVNIILERFGFCLIYDIHSYNIDRQIEKGVASPPVFNLGTGLIDRAGWSAPVDSWLEQLGMIRIPGFRTTVSENEVFSGQGELCRRLTGYHANVLVLPTEISKIYINERTGVINEDVLTALRFGVRSAVTNHVRLVRKMFEA